MTKPGWTYERRVDLPAGRERVWRALTDSEELVRWFADGIEVEPRPGGKYRFWGGRVPGAPPRERAHQRITRFDAGREIAFEWEIEGVESEVILVVETIEGVPDRTRLDVRHKFPAPPAVANPKLLVEDLWRVVLANLDGHLGGGATDANA
ncbi:MAG TPA: SRPBCC domain-containing protein [Thermoanaerobaculia bacterium]|nr:SRPBCC domain-containing protein [Thermoanaerobaculia bacterium]